MFSLPPPRMPGMPAPTAAPASLPRPADPDVEDLLESARTVRAPAASPPQPRPADATVIDLTEESGVPARAPARARAPPEGPVVIDLT